MSTRSASVYQVLYMFTVYLLVLGISDREVLIYPTIIVDFSFYFSVLSGFASCILKLYWDYYVFSLN